MNTILIMVALLLAWGCFKVVMGLGRWLLRGLFVNPIKKIIK